MTPAAAAASVTPIDGTTSGEDPDAGRMFDVPRVGIVIDDTDPTVIKLAFSGSVELDRGNAGQMAFYNGLRPGQSSLLSIDVHVAGAKMAHRRDSEGDVDAVVQTKSLVVTDVFTDQPE